jgi:hypothetical protein
MTLPTQTEDARKRAEASFKKEERAKDGAEAMIEYLANSRATREKTARLKAQRLARETVESEPANKPA